MKRTLEKLAVHILGKMNAYPTRLTSTDELLQLIHKLRPVSAGVGLVRLGPDGDGGYLVPDDLMGIEACFSPGVGSVSGFESDCADLGMQVFLADRSVGESAVSHRGFHLTRRYVGGTAAGGFLTVDDWVASSLADPRSDLLLQIDTEGYEYEIFLGTSDDVMRRFRIIVAEFHSLHKLWSHPFFRLAKRAFEKILLQHTCVHIHPNSVSDSTTIHGLEIPHVMEFTFLRNDRVQERSLANRFPHPLDCGNASNASRPLPSSLSERDTSPQCR